MVLTFNELVIIYCIQNDVCFLKTLAVYNFPFIINYGISKIKAKLAFKEQVIHFEHKATKLPEILNLVPTILSKI